MDILFFTTLAELHTWFEQNHDKATEAVFGFYKKDSQKQGITYKEAVDEALCFGWIDGIRRRIDEVSYSNRFTPRKKSSIWSAVNIKRVGELTEAGRMQPSGLKAFEGRDPKKAKLYSSENKDRKLDGELAEQFKANAAAWEFFQAQPQGYQHTSSWWVISAKREETRQKRLTLLIEASAEGKRLS